MDSRLRGNDNIIPACKMIDSWLARSTPGFFTRDPEVQYVENIRNISFVTWTPGEEPGEPFENFQRPEKVSLFVIWYYTNRP